MKNVTEGLNQAGKVVSKFGAGVVDEIKSIDTTSIKKSLGNFWSKLKGEPAAAATHEPVPNLGEPAADAKDANHVE